MDIASFTSATRVDCERRAVGAREGFRDVDHPCAVGHDLDMRVMTCAVGLAAMLLGCDPGGGGGGEDGESGGAPAEAVPIAIDCSLAFEGQESITLDTPDVEVTRTFGALQMSAILFDDPYEGRSFDIGFHTDDGTVGTNALYQMDRTKLPVNEFWGDHGFTGLQWVKDPSTGVNVQWACFARDPAEPVHQWE